MLIPVVGQISAGSPLDWIPIEKWRWIRPLKNSLPGENIYGLEVVGDSLINEKILSGDVLIFAYGHKAKPGDLCVVRTPYGLTAKRIYPNEEGEVLLKSANEEIPDQVWPCQDVHILGVVKRVERDL